MLTFCQKYAPKSLSDVILSEENAKFFHKDFKLSESPNLLFIGEPGVGKTTLAKILANDYEYLYINASDESGVDTIRNKVSNYIKTSSLMGDIKVVILDEADGLSSVSSGNGSSAQQALRGMIEDNLDHCRFILTANYEHKIIDALQSRCQSFYFQLTKKDVAKALTRIIKEEKISCDKEQLRDLIDSYYPDIRKCINELQKGLDGNNVFHFKKRLPREIPVKIKKLLESKIDVFKIREAVIKEEDNFQSDYHSLMRGLYDLYCSDRNANSVMAICHHMEKHTTVLDKEVNFTSLLLNLSK